MESLKSKSANLLFSGTFFVAVHINIPKRKIRLAKPALDISLYKIKFSKKSMKATSDEKKNNNIKGDFKINWLIIFIVRMASGALVFFKDSITKNENAKYTPPIKPKLIIATLSSHKSIDIILKSIFKSTHRTTNKKPIQMYEPIIYTYLPPCFIGWWGLIRLSLTTE